MFPSLRRERFRQIRLAASLVIVAAGSAMGSEYAPRLFRVANVPESNTGFWDAKPLSGGWVACTLEGAVVQGETGWTLVSTPGKLASFAITSNPAGLLVGGFGCAYLYAEGNWKTLDLQISPWQAETVEGNSLLTSLSYVHLVDRQGRLSILKHYPSETEAKLHRLNGSLYLTSSQEPPQRWDGARFQDASDDLPWLPPQFAPNSIRPAGPDEYVGATEHEMFIVKHGKMRPLLPQWQETFFAESSRGTFAIGDCLVVLTMSGGIRIFSKSDETLISHFPSDQYGAVVGAIAQPEGLVINTFSGLFALPDPSRHRFLNTGSISLDLLGRTAQGVAIGSFGKIIDARGLPVSAPGKAKVGVLLKDGRQVWGCYGGLVVVGDQEITLPEKDLKGIVEMDDGEIAVLFGRRLFYLDTNHAMRISGSRALDTVVMGLARNATGEILIATDRGVQVIRKDGTMSAGWGSRAMTPATLSDGSSVITSIDGHVFSVDGELLADVANGRTIGFEKWRGLNWTLCSFPDGTIWIGANGEKEREWIPYDLPLGQRPQALFVEDDLLYVVCAEEILEVRDPKPLEIPDLTVTVGSDDAIATPRSSHLPSGVDSVALLFPPQRLGPWGNPSYRIRVDDGKWGPSKVVPQARISRLGYGRSVIEVVRTFAGIETATVVTIVRDWPWWGRWPMRIAYAFVGIGLIYVGIASRTRQLKKRAARLEAEIELRTGELKKAQVARETFFSTVSHEIRNPLNGVIGLCDVIGQTDESVPPRTRRHVSTLRGCAEQLRTILDDVIDFTRIDRGEMRIDDEPFDLVAAIEGAAETIDPEATRIDTQMPPGGMWVRGDQGKIRQIVSNLVSNALKYGLPPFAQICCDAQPTTATTLTATIRVRNSGETLRAEELDSLFKEFFRGDAALRRKIPGSGLGLAVSRKMAEAMNGSLAVTSENGQTEFTLSLPLPMAKPGADAADALPSRPKGKRILAVEDEEYNRTVLGFHLRQLGYEVDWAQDGKSALQYVREARYDYILTDFMLPDMTGDELARHLLKILPHPAPPIIAVTAYSTPDKIALAQAAGISRFVTKPVSSKKLQAALLDVEAATGIRSSIFVELLPTMGSSVFRRMPDGLELLARFSESLVSDWQKVAEQCAAHPGNEAVRRTVHAFRSRVLAVRAIEVADQLAALEDAIADSRGDDVTRLRKVIHPLIEDLAQRHRGARANPPRAKRTERPR